MNFIIKGLPFSIHIDSIEKLCSSYGRVMDISTFKEITHSRAYVKMSSNEEAKKSVESINGSVFEGFPLSANIQKKKRPKGLKRKRIKKKYL